MIPILDTHLHLLYQQQFTYGWCEDFPVLQSDFKIEDYQNLIDSKDLDIAGSIFMEVDVDENEISKEAAFFTDLVKKSDNSLVGVIAACRPENMNFHELLESTMTSAVCGLRRVLHVMPDEVSRSSLFRENIRSLVNHKLPFDICIGESQHETGYELIKSCPDNQFVLDHCGNPTISHENFHHWSQSLKKIASLPNVVCKISGIIASLPESSEVNDLNPWIDTTIESFGTDRVMIGSDWPVYNLSRDLPTWIKAVRHYFDGFSESEQQCIFHKNAETIYFYASGSSGKEFNKS